MPRQLRIEYEGAIYHIVNRGDRRERIFIKDEDYLLFLRTLSEVCEKAEWDVHAYCLMGNHFHLVIETPQANLVAGMKWFLGTYTTRFNRRHRLSGHLFSGRYKSLIVDGSGNGYLRTVSEYVHLNPARANLVPPGQPLRGYRWSSFGEYLQPPAGRACWVRVDRVLGEMLIPGDTPAGRREFERQVEARRAAESGAEWAVVRRGWCLGDGPFRHELMALVDTRSGTSHYGSPRRESAEAKAESLVLEELSRRGWCEAMLERARKGDPTKVEIALRLRRETTVTLKWISHRLKMGRWTHAANCIYERLSNRKAQARGASPGTVPNWSGISDGRSNGEEQELNEVRTDPDLDERLSNPKAEARRAFLRTAPKGPGISYNRPDSEDQELNKVRTDPDWDLPVHCL